MLTYVTFVYDFPRTKLRYVLWEYLKNVSSNITGPWMILGNFNQVNDTSEKHSRNTDIRGALAF